MSLNTKYLVYCFTYASYLTVKVVAELCEDGSRCTDGKHCCTVGCCYADDDEDDRRYAYGYRLSIWNMWYFWFVILFLMMSCFGGCGYYKQRQRLLRGQTLNNGRGLVSILGAPLYRRTRAPVETYPNVGGVYPVYTASADPNSEASNLEPPPYTEVMNHPDMFPPNTKAEGACPDHILAGPGYPVNTVSTESANQMPRPPPYSEVANQSSGDLPSTNQTNPVQNQAP